MAEIEKACEVLLLKVPCTFIHSAPELGGRDCFNTVEQGDGDGAAALSLVLG